MGKRSAFPLLNQVRKNNVLNSIVASLIMSDSTAHLKMIQMKSTSTSHQHSHSRCTIVFCIHILTPCFFRAGHVTCSDHTTLDGGALRHAPLRLSVCSGRSDQSDWLYTDTTIRHNPRGLYYPGKSGDFHVTSFHFRVAKKRPQFNECVIKDSVSIYCPWCNEL